MPLDNGKGGGALNAAYWLGAFVPSPVGAADAEALASSKFPALVFSKSQSDGILKNPALDRGSARVFPEGRRGLGSGESLEKEKSGLADLQAFETAQNRQDIPWKSLEKKALDLRKLGKIP